MRHRNIIKPIVFLTGLFLLLITLSYFIIPNNSIEEGPYKKLGSILNAPENTFDYLVIGDSEGSTSISPMEIWKDYGYAGYNCGVPGQPLQDTYYMLEKLLTKQSPKVILLETNTFYRDIKYTNALKNELDEAVKKIFPIYKYHNSWKYINLGMFKNIGSNSESNPILFKGFYYNIVVKPYKKGPYIHKTRETIKINERPLSYLIKIVNLCREKNIKLILYSVPAPLCWTYPKHNAAAAFAKENQLPYLDLNLKIKELGINWKRDTRDRGNHMNFYGAKKVTNYIGTYLFEHSNLTDHRNEIQYELWNTELIKYLKVTNQS